MLLYSNRWSKGHGWGPKWSRRMLRKNEIYCVALHGIIHKEALCGEVLKMINVMQSVIKMVNLIRGGHKVQRQQRFVGFLRELDVEFSDLPLYASIRWLSAGKIVKHFFGLAKKFFYFLKNN